MSIIIQNCDLVSLCYVYVCMYIHIYIRTYINVTYIYIYILKNESWPDLHAAGFLSVILRNITPSYRLIRTLLRLVFYSPGDSCAPCPWVLCTGSRHGLICWQLCTKAEARFGFSTKLESIEFLTALLLEIGFSDVASCRLLSS